MSCQLALHFTNNRPEVESIDSEGQRHWERARTPHGVPQGNFRECLRESQGALRQSPESFQGAPRESERKLNSMNGN